MSPSTLAREGQYLTFTLNLQMFAIPIEVVREIDQLPLVTPIPNAPGSIAGVINLRDKVIPVVDLRYKFNFQVRDNTRETCVIVVDSVQGQVAVIVDTVASVVFFRQDQMEAAPSLVQNPTAAAPILGLAKAGPAVFILLNMALVVSQESIHEITDLGSWDALQSTDHLDDSSGGARRRRSVKVVP